MVKLKYSRPALTDLHNTFLYISNDSVVNAQQFVRTIKNRIKILKSYPETGMPLFPQKFTYVRQVLYKSYRVIYMYERDIITILAIQHQSRLIENIEAIKKYII